MTAEKLLLFIPCYNCAPQIERTLSQLKSPIAGRLAEVLVLDNRSTDETMNRARATAAEINGVSITIARNCANYHLGGSHKAAFAYAETNGFTHVIVLHGDDQGDVADLADILERGVHRQYDACLGARFAPGSKLKGYSIVRTFGNKVFNGIFSIVTRRRIYDLGSGLNIFSKNVFMMPEVTRASDDLRFNVYLLLFLIRKRQRIHFFPISWREDDQISNVRLFSQALRTLKIASDYLLRPETFMQDDHRDRKIEAYTFEVIERFLVGDQARGSGA